MEYLIVTLVLVITSIYLYFKYTFGYWRRKNVPCVEPRIPFGNLGNPLKKTQGFHEDVTDVYKQLKAQGHKHGGFYVSVAAGYMPIDIEYVKNVMSKDFNHFVNHGTYYNERDDPLSANLFAIEDLKWKNLRAKLTPTFTSGKMKMMFQTLLDCSAPLIEDIDASTAKNNPLDIKELVARFSTDVIGSCAFGIDCNSFKDPDAEFRKYGKKSFQTDLVTNARIFVMITLPEFAKKLGMGFTRKDVSEFFLNMVRNTVKYREENNVKRPDFMQLLIELKNKKEGGLTMNELSAQAFIFFLAGFETSSTTMSFCFYELAKNVDIQQKLRDEINAVLAKHNNEITYESLNDMKYLGQVIDETLRKYPPLGILNRTCNAAYQVPGTDVVIEKGTPVLIPAYSIQHDPDYYPDPEKFDPDRFSEENKDTRVPFTFLPFGEGPRICIGLRFGLMQTKIGLVSILRNFRLTLNGKMPKEMKIDPDSFILAFKDTIWLDSEKIDK